MNFISRYFFNKYIAENKTNRDIHITSLQKAKSVGIICDITTEDTYKEIYAIFAGLQNTRRAAWLIGYIDDKLVPFYCLQQLTADFFCYKDLNWYSRPEKVQIKDFINTEFDILIDFSHENYPALQAILELSHAHFIVGGASCKAKHYDLLINTPEKLSHQGLLTHIECYTKQLAGESL